ncbi:MAG: hypothetical protein AAGG07_05405 [Planctomycetota bacterium]
MQHPLIHDSSALMLIPGALPPPGTGEEGSALRDLVPAALMLVAVVMIMTSLIKRRSKTKSVGGPAERAAHQPWHDTKQRLDDIRSAARGRESLETVMADCEELAQRMASIMEAKAARLETLIADADERLAKLERSEQRGATPSLAAEPEVRLPRRTHSGDQRPEPPTSPAAPEPDQHGDMRQRIYDLADQGLSPVQIAQRTSQPTGQVELVLALRRA